MFSFEYFLTSFSKKVLNNVTVLALVLWLPHVICVLVQVRLSIGTYICPTRVAVGLFLLPAS